MDETLGRRFLSAPKCRGTLAAARICVAVVRVVHESIDGTDLAFDLGHDARDRLDGDVEQFLVDTAANMR